MAGVKPNVLLVLIDSLNRHALGAYGGRGIDTPNLDRFAARALRFDNHFVGSLPCMPARREIIAGRTELMWRAWGPLEPFDERLPVLLAAHGYRTALVTDHYHYWEESANGYLQAFASTELIRGHELDFWRSPAPDDAALPRWVRNVERWRPGKGLRYYGNVRHFGGEEDFFPARVMTAAAEWLRAHGRAGAPFFLQVESFDVHEPFHLPEPYASMYGRGDDRDRYTVWPPYQVRSELKRFLAATTPGELAFIRSQYAGKLTMVDRWFGALLEALDELGLWDDTMVVVTTDHGHDLAERLGFGKQYPHFDSHANIPLLVWHPEHPGHGAARAQLSTTVDLFATVLDAAGVPDPARSSHGCSLLPVLSDARAPTREALLYGSFGQGICCTDGRWTVMKAPEHERFYSYSTMAFDSLIADTRDPPVDQGHFIPGVPYPQWKTPVRLPLRSQSHDDADHLFHRHDDPGQGTDLWAEEPGQRRRMLELLRDLLDVEGAPPEQLQRFGFLR